MEVDVLWAKAAVFVLMASFLIGFTKPELLDMGPVHNGLESFITRVLVGWAFLASSGLTMLVMFLGFLGVRFLLG